MKIRKDKDILRFLGIGLSVILLGAAMLVLQMPSKAISFLGGGLILAGLIMFIMALYAATKPKTDLIVDERVAGINEKAGYHACWIVLLAITILYWADRIWVLGIELKDMYWTTIFVGAYTFLILRWYYNKRSGS